MNSSHSVKKKNQAGAALVVVLMLLIIITLLGLASMRGALMQERMAGHTQGRAVAFQAAEAGLRQAEVLIRDTGGMDLSGIAPGTCVAGRCGRPDTATGRAGWEAEGFWAGDGPQSGDPVKSGDITMTPRFVIEYFGVSRNDGSGPPPDMSKPPIEGPEQKIYRITSYAVTPNGVETVVQSLYRR